MTDIIGPIVAVGSRHYASVHQWLKRVYGRSNRCENPNCSGTSKVFDWALKKGCFYEKVRDNFFMLCRGCHIAYDATMEANTKRSQSMRGHRVKRDTRKKIIENMPHSRPVLRMSQSGEVEKRYPSIMMAAKDMRVTYNTIVYAASRPNKVLGGSLWKFDSRLLSWRDRLREIMASTQLKDHEKWKIIYFMEKELTDARLGEQGE